MTAQDAQLQAALLRISMDLRMKRAPSIEAATAQVAEKMGIDREQLSAYISAHFKEFISATQHDLVRERVHVK